MWQVSSLIGNGIFVTSQAFDGMTATGPWGLLLPSPGYECVAGGFHNVMTRLPERLDS
jgi:hypothetical protein